MVVSVLSGMLADAIFKRVWQAAFQACMSVRRG
jgi:hypothetical protein